MEIGSSEWIQLLSNGASVLGFALDERTLRQFAEYAAELVAWNKKVNLTAILDPDEIAIKHFLDSMAPASLISPNASVIDIGSGAGFPGIPLKMTNPTMEVTLLEAVRKKVSFLRHVIRRLDLKGIRAENGRAEQWHRLDSVPKFDVAICRALSDLEAFVRIASPLLQAGGRLLAMKGKTPDAEVKTLAAGSGKNPFAWEIEIVRYRLPFINDDRSIVVLRHSA